MATKFNKHQYVELLIQPGQANPGFTPQQYLQNRQIYSIEAFNNDDIGESRSNNALISSGMMSGMFLNLYCTDANLPMQAIPNSTQFAGQGWGLWFRDIPLIEYHRVSSGSNSYVRDLYEMYGEFIDFEQSYVNIAPFAQTLISDGGVPVVALFTVGYK